MIVNIILVLLLVSAIIIKYFYDNVFINLFVVFIFFINLWPIIKFFDRGVKWNKKYRQVKG